MQEAIIQVLNRLPESSQKKLAIERVRTVKIKTEYCDGDRDMVLLPNAYYSPNSHTFNFCLNQMFRAESLFSTIFIMAHEISHSIDPCVLMQNPPVFDRLTSCFAQPQSVGANIGCNRDNIGFQCDPRPLSGETPIGCGPGSTPDKCLPLESTRPAPNCYATTQIQNTPQDGEVFSDWMGAEVLGALASGQFAPMRNLSREQHAIGLANAFPFCEFSGSVVQSREGNTYEHLLDRDRFNLLASQPSIRQNMGCESAGPQMYCTLEGSASPAPSETTAPSPTQGVAQ